MDLLPGDSAQLRKARGAFFTPTAIAEHLAGWAIQDDPTATVLDPTCGDGVFLMAAGQRLKALGRQASDLDGQVFGIDLHESSLHEADRLLEAEGLDAHLIASDFFAVPTPDQLGAQFDFVDAVIGNPPFVRYQQHVGASRHLSSNAALRQGVRLNGMASSWAASLAHASGFLKPDGRLAMVLPAELLTVGYAEPVRRWLKKRFERVNLVLFERLQFHDALADVVLLLAEGRGGCDAFSLWHVESAEDLAQIRPYMQLNVTPPESGKWTDILVPKGARGLYREVTSRHFTTLDAYGTSSLGTVTGGNAFFALNESTRLEYGLKESQLARISPPGTRHLRGSAFTRQQWQVLREAGERVWLFRPGVDDMSAARIAYSAYGETLGIDQAYKCQIRTPWWRPPFADIPDLFFTYMSHNYPRLIANPARAGLLNSMHGVTLRSNAPKEAVAALPFMCLNSVTMLGAEVNGRSYGGGILKMEPREAAQLPLPAPDVMAAAWHDLKPLKPQLDRQLKRGSWTEVSKRVDAAVLGAACGLGKDDVSQLLGAARQLRERRLRRAE
ncbi:N-6 DNA methylase [Cellulosimicrobium cellulans]|uniref:N-6 DNA methylase n=1 Tax=Cellulosimicrobium cellulans TaxID=1710 RepID=UPI0012FDA67C|nr:N-6 DNA methylase [Cellulosimicrobium cellulans]